MVSMPQSAGTAFEPLARLSDGETVRVSMPQSAGTAFEHLASADKNIHIGCFNASIGRYCI